MALPYSPDVDYGPIEQARRDAIAASQPPPLKNQPWTGGNPIMDFLRLFGIGNPQLGGTPFNRYNARGQKLDWFGRPIGPGIADAFSNATVSNVSTTGPMSETRLGNRDVSTAIKSDPRTLAPAGYVPMGSKYMNQTPQTQPRTTPWTADDYAKMGVTGLTDEEMQRYNPGMFAPRGPHPTFGGVGVRPGSSTVNSATPGGFRNHYYYPTDYMRPSTRTYKDRVR